jgi:hypothetical protein
LPEIGLPSSATIPTDTTPARADSTSTCVNVAASACSWRTRNRAIVAWSGIRFAQITRKATSSRQRRSICRDERSPTA